MSNSLQHLLNPVDEHDRQDEHQTPVSHVSLANQQSTTMSNIPTEIYFNTNGSLNMDFSMGLWNDYTGELPRVSEYLGPGSSNPLA
jgi:hypothetical protein